MRLFLIASLLLISACVDRSIVPVAPETLKPTQVEEVLTATLREPVENGWFSDARAGELHFVDLDVAIPPKRKKGQIRLQLSRKINPETHFTMADRKDLPSQQAFTDAIRARLQGLSRDQQDVMIYVHGYNNSFADGVFRTAQMKADFQVPGVALHYSWASAANPLGYTYDRDSVLYSRDGLEQMLTAVTRAKPRRIVLVGHSLGTMLVMETLRQMEIRHPSWAKRHLGGVVLISPDLDVELFRMQAERIAELPQPFVIFTSSRDRALQLSARINGSQARLGGLKDPMELADLPLTILDVSEFASGIGSDHFTVGTSPLLIQLLGNGADLQAAFDTDRAGRSGLLPGTVITAQNATQIVLSPLLLAN